MDKNKILELFLALYQRVDLERQLDAHERLGIELNNEFKLAMHEQKEHQVSWAYYAEHRAKEQKNISNISDITTALADNMKRLNEAKEDFLA
ncbi:MAG: hypothetical protein AAB586_01840 [Patescibacteria group bacterium]